MSVFIRRDSVVARGPHREARVSADAPPPRGDRSDRPWDWSDVASADRSDRYRGRRFFQEGLLHTLTSENFRDSSVADAELPTVATRSGSDALSSAPPVRDWS